jgi:hypothetical protein
MVTSRISVGLVLAYVLYRLFLLRPVRVSKAFLAELLAWSTRPSFFRRLFPVSAPAASLMRPFAC